MPLPAAARPSRAPAALAGIAAGALSLASGWGFTVDDALISARVAHHLSTGFGYVFNPDGPVVDCVTPLGWSVLLAAIPGATTLEVFEFARLVSAGSWLVASAMLGHFVSLAAQGWRKLAIFLLIAAFLPFGAWASSGMETGVVLALSTAAIAPLRLAPLWGGLAAALRPELTPWAVVLALTRTLGKHTSKRQQAYTALLALGPALIVCTARLWAFGRIVPLSVFAKPSTAEAGLHYLWGAFFLAGPTWLLVSRRILHTCAPLSRPIVAALLVHAVVLLGVGGDWMPLWRLAIPVLPGAFVVGAHLAEHRPAPQTIARILICFTLSGLWHWRLGPSTRGVVRQRERLMTSARPLLVDSTTVATLDIGWPGALGHHQIVDLAGLTDERIATLPGGHTSKQLPMSFLENRNPQTLLLLLRDAHSWPTISQLSLAQAAPSRPFARNVENRLAAMPSADAYFPVRPLHFGKQAYVLYEALLSP